MNAIKNKKVQLPWRVITRTVAVLVWMLSIGWIIKDGGFEPIITFFTATVAFIASFIGAGDRDTRNSKSPVNHLTKTLVWNKPQGGQVLPTDNLPVTNCYVSRGDMETTLKDLIKEFSIIVIEGPSGIGKTFLVSRVAKELGQEGVFARIIYFDSQPELATLRMALEEAYPDSPSPIKELDNETAAVIVDGFKLLSEGWSKFLEDILKYTITLKILLICTERLSFSFPDHPKRLGLFELKQGFAKSEAIEFLNKTSGTKNLDSLDFDKIYSDTGNGFPRAMANFVSFLAQGNAVSYDSGYQDEGNDSVMSRWSRLLLQQLSKEEIRLVGYVAISPSYISIANLSNLYKRLHPLRYLFREKTAHQHLQTKVRKLIDTFVLTGDGSNNVTIHDCFRAAIELQLIEERKAHRLMSETYLSRYTLRQFNPDSMPSQEILDKWSAIFHSYQSGDYNTAGLVLSEIYPFLNKAGLQGGADQYLEELHSRLRGQVPWISFLLAYRRFETNDIYGAISIIESVTPYATNPRLKIRLMSLKAELLFVSGDISDAKDLCELNIRILHKMIEQEQSYSLMLANDPNLDSILAWNFVTLSKIENYRGYTQLAQELNEEAEDIIRAGRVRKETVETRLRLPH